MDEQIECRDEKDEAQERLAQVEYLVEADSVVPADMVERAQWIEEYGPIAQRTIAVDAVATLKAWAQARCVINPDGTVAKTSYQADKEVNQQLRAVLSIAPAAKAVRVDEQLALAAQRIEQEENERQRLIDEQTKREASWLAAWLAAPDDAVVTIDGVATSVPHDHDAGDMARFNTNARQVWSVGGRDVLGSAKDTQAFKEALARRIEKAKRKQDARREIEQAKEQARIDNALAWIVEQADLPARMRRAAAEGRSGALDEVADYLTQALGKEAQRLAREALPNWRPEWATYVDTYDFEVPERVPSDDAYAVRDALVEGQASMRAAALADDGGEIEVSECGRADIAPTGKSVWRGAVRVTVRHRQLGIDMRATVLTEPLAYGGESEDER